jgi:alpha-galactosidase
MITTLAYNDQSVQLTPGDMRFFEELYVDFKIDRKANQTRLHLSIHPKQKVTLRALTIALPLQFTSSSRIFCNGFQSHSESKEYQINASIPQLHSLALSRMQYYGDTHLKSIRRTKGHFHSWTYGYHRQGDRLHFIGSLADHRAFTLIQYDTINNQVIIEIDCEGLELAHSFPILDLLIAEGHEAWVFNTYFNALDLRSLSTNFPAGWTSWYNYYTKVTELDVLKNAEAFSKRDPKVDIIQIDDGYQNAVGDWLNVKDSFPSGMAKIASKIKSLGFKAGIWLAPFICDGNSEIFKQKKHWLVKDAKGQVLKVGYNRNWNGWFYALDFYNKNVQDYLLAVLQTITQKWGYDLLKLDFLFAACLVPPSNKTRGQLMADAMDFLRRTIGEQKILACGVPLGSAFGKVEYCRIGPDIHLSWEHKLLNFLGHRERVSTIAALQTVLGRWQLNGRVFHSDPDVILLRDQNIQLNPHQQYTILLINTLLGNVHFTSDYVREYTEEQWAEFLNIHTWRDAQIKAVSHLEKNLYQIQFTKDGLLWMATCNLTAKKLSVPVGKTRVNLLPYESIILRAY